MKKLNSSFILANGVIYYSKKHPKYLAIATRKNDHLSAEWTTVDKCKEEMSPINTLASIFYLLFLFFATVISFFLLSIPEGIYSPADLRYCFLGIGILLFIFFFAYVYARKKKSPNISKYTAAVNQVVNAYEKLNRIPSLEEAKSYSMYDTDSLVNTNMQIIIIYIILYFTVQLSTLATFEVCTFSLIFVTWLARKLGLLNFMQKFTTDTPTDKELEVALACLKVWYENE